MPTVSIPLNQSKFVLVDEADLPIVSAFKWSANRVPTKHGERWYAVARMDGKRIYMHRLLLGFPPNKVDHRNGDGLDNQRRNIREATNSGNGANARTAATSGYRGVSWHAGKQRWDVCVFKDRKKVFYKSFHDLEDAARAYDEAARRVHGEFAYLNFPGPGERGVTQ